MAGKGDRDRTRDRAAYRRNYDAIDWSESRARRMTPEEARDAASPEILELADRMGWEVAGIEARLAVSPEVLGMVQESPGTAFRQMLERHRRETD